MSIDTYAERFQNMILSWIPPSVIPYLLRFIVACSLLLETVYHQAITTGTSIYHSFCNPVFLFHKINGTYVLNVCNSRTRYQTMTPHEWEYNPTTKQFISHQFSTNDTTYSIPYLGASISYNLNGVLEPICDMSEWISEQKVVAPNNNLPFQVLVGTYLYLNRNMRIYDYTNYVLQVTTDMAEDFAYDVSSEHVINVVDSAESDATDATNVNDVSDNVSQVSTADSASEAATESSSSRMDAVD